MQTAQRPLARTMWSLLTGYAGAFNRHHRRSGHLFQRGIEAILKSHPAASGQNPGAVISGKLVPKRRITGRESAFLKQHAPGPYKITIPSPTGYLRGYIKGTSDQVYPSQADVLKDLTDIVHQEVKALVEEGVPYVQIDSIRYVFDFTDEQRRREWQELGIDPDQATLFFRIDPVVFPMIAQIFLVDVMTEINKQATSLSQ